MKTQVNKTSKLYPDIYERWSQNRTPENTSELLKTMSPLISSAIKSYAGGDNKHKTRANILALNAIKSYDPSKGVQLNTYVMSQLRALNRIARQKNNIIHVPENIYLNKQAIKEARAEYMEKYNREPTETALADATGLTVRQVQQTEKYGGHIPSAMTMSDKGDSMTENKRDYYDIWTDYVYNDMDDKDKKIFEGVSGYNGATIKPKQVIARELKMTPAAVSYRINNITKRLEEMPTEDVG